MQTTDKPSKIYLIATLPSKRSLLASAVFLLKLLLRETVQEQRKVK